MADPQPTDPAAPPVPKPAGLWGMILTVTPVALTALAGAFAGLSSSAMTQAMYHRSLAAQHQSRAGNQWAFFQAKRIRGNGIESSVELLQALGHPEPFDAARAEAALTRMRDLLNDPRASPPGEGDGPKAAGAAIQKARDRLAGVKTGDFALPAVEPAPLPDPAARQAFEEVVQAIQKRKTEAETEAQVAKLSPETIDEAIRLAEDDADRFDRACEPVTEQVRQLKALFNELGAAVRPLRAPPSGNGPPRDGHWPAADVPVLFDRLDAGFRAAAMDFEARRYRQEASFNRRAAEAYEVRVRRSGIESDRHRERSMQFFYSMLLAQVGVTVSSLALAKAHRSWLWFFAAVVGVVSLGFTGYVYLSY